MHDFSRPPPTSRRGSLLLQNPPNTLAEGNERDDAMANAMNAIYRLAIPAAVGASLISSSIYDVKGGTRAVIFDRLSGVKEQVVNEGTHFLIPWLQRSIIFDVRTKPRNIATTTGSKDLQMVSLTLRVLHRPEVQALPKIYQVCIDIYTYIPLFLLSSFPVDLPRWIHDFPSDPQEANWCGTRRTSVKITTSECSPRSATKCSSPSWRNSTRPSSSRSERRCRSASGPTC